LKLIGFGRLVWRAKLFYVIYATPTWSTWPFTDEWR